MTMPRALRPSLRGSWSWLRKPTCHSRLRWCPMPPCPTCSRSWAVGFRSCSTASIIATAQRRGRRRPSSPRASRPMRRLRDSPRAAPGSNRLPAPARSRCWPLHGTGFPRCSCRGSRPPDCADLSTYGARAAAVPVPGITQVNTHVDIIAWRDGRGFVGEDEALGLAVRHLAARRAGAVESAEPTGWLTHHACHDEAAWKFLRRLFETTLHAPGILWRRAEDLFGDGRVRG